MKTHPLPEFLSNLLYYWNVGTYVISKFPVIPRSYGKAVLSGHAYHKYLSAYIMQNIVGNTLLALYILINRGSADLGCQNL